MSCQNKAILNDSGNALFLILIAVALFAALSYAVTNSGRGGGGISKEQAAIAASQMQNTIALFQTAITRMDVLDGSLNKADIRFCNAPLTTGGSTIFSCQLVSGMICPDQSDCIFAPEGGGMTPPDFPSDQCTDASACEWQFSNMFLPNLGAGAILMSPVINETLCFYYNQQQGIGARTLGADTEGNMTGCIGNSGSYFIYSALFIID